MNVLFRRAASALVLATLLTSAGCSEVPGDAAPSMGALSIGGVVEGATLSGVVTITADVDGRAPDAFDVFVGDRRAASVKGGVRWATLDTRTFHDAVTKVRVEVLADATNYSREVGVTIDNTPPSVALVSPPAPLVYSNGDGVTITLDVEDVSTITQLAVKANGVTVPVQGKPYTASVSLAALGRTAADLPLAVNVEVRAVDKASLVTTRSFALTLASRVAWSFAALGEIWAPPAFGATGIAYFGARDGKLYSVTPAGAPASPPVALGKEILFTPAVDSTGGPDRVWVSAGDTVVALDVGRGQTTSSWTAAATLGTGPVLGATALFVGTFGGELVALDRATLAKRWSFATTAPVESTPLVLPGDVAVFGADDRFVHAVGATGTEQWRLETGGPVWSRAIATHDGDVVIGSHDGYLYRATTAGAKRWEFDAEGQVWGAAAEAPSGALYVGSTFGALRALNAQGKEMWKHDVGGLAFSTPAVSKSGRVYVAATNGTVVALAPSGELLWSHALGAELVGGAVLSPDQKTLLVGTKDRRMVALYTGDP